MSLLSNLFKSKKTPSYQGATPYGSLLDATGGKEYYDKILARSQGGGGVGYSPDYVEKASNPVIARMRNQFNAYDLPELKSELTATGRRAGSPGFAQISKAYENQGLNEEAAYAPIYQQAEEARRADINAGINNLGAFNTGDYNAKNTQANFAHDVYKQETNNIQNDRSRNDAVAGQILQAGAQALPMFGGAISGLGGMVNRIGGIGVPIGGAMQSIGGWIGDGGKAYQDAINARARSAQRGVAY